jgi:hypothetical protein
MLESGDRDEFLVLRYSPFSAIMSYEEVKDSKGMFLSNQRERESTVVEY